MVRAFETALSTSLTSADALSLLISGTTFWAAIMLFGSSSVTSLLAMIDGVVE